jgi:RND family efflux transporter MFP subunit
VKEVDLGKLRVDRNGRVGPKAASVRKRLSVPKLALAAAIVLVVGWFLLPKPVRIQTTQVVSAWPSQQYQLLNATGYVVAERKAALAPRGTGRVAWLGAGEGDSVKAGTLVAQLESKDVEAGYQAAKANVAVAVAAVTNAQGEFDDATRDLKREDTLFKKHMVPLVMLQQAESRLQHAAAGRSSAVASLEAARANERSAFILVDSTQIRAPFDGVVIGRSANVGDIVTPLASAADAKGAILTIADMTTLEVEAEVSESSLSQIRVGQPCEIVLDAFPDRHFRGKVSIIVPTVNRASATVTTKVRFIDHDASILPDMSARVAFLSREVGSEDRKPVLAVNPAAISEQGGQAVVFQIGADGRAHALAVKAGRALGEVREISGGLKIGDALALAAPGKLQDGVRVELADAK